MFEVFYENPFFSLQFALGITYNGRVHAPRPLSVPVPRPPSPSRNFVRLLNTTGISTRVLAVMWIYLFLIVFFVSYRRLMVRGNNRWMLLGRRHITVTISVGFCHGLFLIISASVCHGLLLLIVSVGFCHRLLIVFVGGCHGLLLLLIVFVRVVHELLVFRLCLSWTVCFCRFLSWTISVRRCISWTISFRLFLSWSFSVRRVSVMDKKKDVGSCHEPLASVGVCHKLLVSVVVSVMD